MEVGTREWFKKLFQKYQDIINIMVENQDVSGICNITQKENAEKLDMCEAYVSKCLRRLESSDTCIKKISPGKYKVYHTDMIQHGPYKKVIDYCSAVNEDKRLLKLKYKEQADLLGITVDEIKMIWGYIHFDNSIEINELIH